MSTVQKKPAGRINRTDCAAFVVCAALFAFFLYRIGRGIGIADESFYYTITQRLLQGDRLFIDEWQVSQLSSFLLVPPCWLYTRITGGYDGVLLFMRHVYIFCCFCVYWFLYIRMRRYKGVGLAAVALFSAYICFVPTLNYMTMSIQGTAVFCALVFLGREKQSVPTLLFAGVVLSCTVLAEPVFATAYFLYSALVLVYALCKRRGVAGERADFALNARSWFFISAGVLACFVAFLLFLQVRYGLAAVFKMVPELLSDSEYNLGVGTQRWLWPGKKFNEFNVRLYGEWPLRALMWVMTIAGVNRLLHALFFRVRVLRDRLESWAFFARIRQPGFAAAMQAALLCAGCVFFVAAYVYALINLFLRQSPHQYTAYADMVLCQALPPCAFGCVCYCLCRKRDARLFCFLVGSLLLSVVVDCASDMVFQLGGPISILCGVPHFCMLLREITDGAERLPFRQTKKRRIYLRALQAVMASCVVIFGAWTVVYLLQNARGVVERCFLYEEGASTSLSVKLEDGVFKGVRTTPIVQANYEDILADLDTIKESGTGPLYVTRLAPSIYLNADLPYATYSAWFVDSDKETRLLRYWQLFPSRLPESIYVPLVWFENDAHKENRTQENAENAIEFFSGICTFEQTTGKAGEILHVLSWDTDKIDAFLASAED